MMSYIKAIKEMYDGVKMLIRTVEEDAEYFSVKLGLH